MLNLFNKSPKGVMIFSALCIVIGIIFFFAYDSLKDQGVSIFGVEIFHRLYELLGRYGLSGFFVIGGLIIGLRGLLAAKQNKQAEQQKQN
ncbi:MAG TPA: hypothetical protein VL651_14460 [Bacteroidia bacterium]|jgi:hypothetical protein|nr:hypothetical protein [Bacteroidia bacterium]